MMKTRYYLQFLFCLMILVNHSQYVHGQSSGGHVVRQECSVCGKLIKNCPYKGKHPKCSTCGKMKDYCPYKGNHPKPQPTTGTLSITSSPSDAVVKVDGKYMGTTPLTLDNQNPGIYKMTLSAEGYQTDTLSVIVSVGKTSTCSATLKQKQVSQPVAQQSTNQASTLTLTSSSYQIFEVKGISFRMINVEGGTFIMGATVYDGECDNDEQPSHRVTLSSYSIGETEVTQALWEAVMGSNPSTFKGNSHPVEMVSWDDCQTFIRKLNSMTGRNFRLPTEAEWEYAARGGNLSQGYKYSGSNTLDDVAWCGFSGGTHVVKIKSPNELGIYDMSGNVEEWCNDWYCEYTTDEQINPIGPSSGLNRVHRGGSWILAKGCRVSYRGCGSLGNRSKDCGLRLAL